MSVSTTGGPVFVVGYPHSGTTLLQMIINAHDGFYSGPETHFFRYALLPIADWIRRPLGTNDMNTVLDRLRAKDVPVSTELADSLRADARDQGVGAGDLLNRLMRAQRQGAEPGRWVEKTPDHALFAPQIRQLFPDARIVHLVRDPRDAVSSLLRYREQLMARRRRLFIASRARRWQRLVHQVAHWEAHDAGILTVRYEDLVTATDDTTARVMTFLGGVHDPAATRRFGDGFEDVVRPWETWKSLCKEGSIVDRRGIWRQRIDRRDASVIDLMTRPGRQRHGYPPLERTPRDTITLASTLAVDWLTSNARQVIGNRNGQAS